MSHKDRGMSICPGTVLSVLSFVLYCAGFIRIEVNLSSLSDRLVAVEETATELKQSHQNHLISNEDVGPVVLNFKTLKRTQRSPLNSGSVLNDTTYGLKEVVEDIFSTSMKICQQQGSNKFCLRGRPGPPGRTGSKGDKGDQGKKGRRGSRGMMGEPGRSGKQGIMGPPGVRGEKGVKGNIGPQGAAGIKGEPGESISPPKVTIASPVLIVNESNKVSLLCSVSGNPSTQPLWSKLNGSLPSSRMKVTSDGLMQIVNVKLEDAGKYKCLARNILGKSEKVAELVVQARPRISLSLGPTYVQLGHNVTLPECVAVGFPAPQIRWSRAKSDLRQEKRHNSNKQLLILNVERSDSGLYWCKAFNKLGTDTASTHLVVVEKPKFLVRPPSHLETRIFQNITVACQATGNPLPRIYWKKENGNLPSGRSNSGADGKLKIWGVQPEDSGNYKCVASSVDVSIQTMHLSVQASCKPVGVADRNKIPDDRMTASNIYSGHYRAYFGRLHETRGKSWCPKAKEDRTDFLQVDLGKLYTICAVATQGCRVDSNEYVKSYKLHLSADGTTWKPYKEQNVEKIFSGNTNNNGVVQNALPTRATARFVRFYPVTSGTYPALRVEIFDLM